MTRAARRTSVAVALAALTAACGSTVQVTGSATVGDGLSSTGGGLSGATGTTGGTTGGSTGAGGSLPGVQGGGSSGTPGAVASTKGGGTGSSGLPAIVGGIPATGRGWDAKHVYIGVVTQKDAQTAFQTVGVNGLDGGDQEGQAQAVADDINRRGGLFGRKVTLVFHDVSTIPTAQDPNGTGQATCTFFTQDHPVVAVMSPVTLMDVPAYRGCMQKAKVPLYSLTVQGIDDKVLNDLAPYYYSGVAPAWDQLAPVQATQLKAMGYFSGWNPQTGTAGPNPVKVGVLVPDDTVGPRIGAIITRALAAVGERNVLVYRYGTSNVSQGMSAAVINFAGNQVTHVITVNSDQLAFELSASTQGYKPRYGLTSYSAMQAELESNGPAGQNNGAMGVGWSPSLDVSLPNDPGMFSKGEADCLRIQKAGGQVFGDKRLAQTLAMGMCDGMLLVAKGAVLGGGLSGTQIYAGILKAVPTFSPAISFGFGMGAGRLFVPGGVRQISYVQACRCFRYGSATTYPLR